MLGQLLIGIESTTLTHEDIRRLSDDKVGGVVLFSRNYKNKQQLQDLCQDIKNIKYPRLLVTVDHEGGLVQRFREDFTRLPSVYILYNEDAYIWKDSVYKHAYIMASELISCGVDLSYAPVADVYDVDNPVIHQRAFSPDISKVSQMVSIYIQGMQDAGMSSVIKHLPGHGRVNVDSHLSSAIDYRSLEDLEDSCLVPFLDNLKIANIMVGHIKHPNINNKLASLDSFWYKEYLYHKGFKNITFSDCLTMQSALNEFDSDIVMTVQSCLDAGCDMPMICNNFTYIDTVINHIDKTNDMQNKIKNLYSRS